MKRNMSLGLLLVFAVIFFAGVSTASACSMSEELEQILEDLKAEYDLTTVAAAVVNSNGPAASAAVGLRQRCLIGAPPRP